MNTTKEALKFTAKMVDGKLYEYEDGYIIECLVLGDRVLFNYDSDGVYEKTEIKR